MMEAYRLTRKDGAPGIDGVTAADYEASLEANLLDLLERIRSGRYRAPPVRRAYIPKADGSQRKLGIPTFEDKVAQRAVTMVLEAVYEQDFLPCSYGFRPGRSAHQALRTLQNVLWAKRLYWVLDIDIRKYFDSIPHSDLRAFLDRRVTDGVVRRMIDKAPARDILIREPETDELRAFGGSRSDKFNGVLINALARRASDRALTRRRCREGSYHWWRRDWWRRYCRRRWCRRTWLNRAR